MAFRHSKRLTRALGLLLACFTLFVVAEVAPASQPSEEVALEGDRITYDQAQGVATAEGNVRAWFRNVRIFASHLEMDTRADTILATGEPGKPVTIIQGGRKAHGEKLVYDMQSGRGELSQASGSVDSIYLRGKSLKVLPLSEAKEEGVISERRAKGVEPDEAVYTWEKVSVTTCPEFRPHYRLVTKKMVAIPGKRIIIHNPQVYIGETLLFTYPFNYIVDQGKRKATHFMPIPRYNSDKGVGLGVQVPFAWEKGGATLDVIGWQHVDPEGRLAVVQELDGGWQAFLNSAYEYDSSEDDSAWRPNWGLNYNSPSGWSGRILWSERESVDIDDVAGQSSYEGILWRDPEVYLYGPWWRDPASGVYWRMAGTWGNYIEEAVEQDRRGLGMSMYQEWNRTGRVAPFARMDYWYYDYDEADDQKVTDLAAGLRWGLGSVRFRSAYVRRWVDGESPMKWDDYDEREKVYQRITVPLSEQWMVSLRGAYDLIDEDLEEMLYEVTLDQGCLLWELTYLDDRDGDDDWAGLKLTVTAYPDTPMAFQDKSVYVPGARPKGVPGENEENDR